MERQIDRDMSFPSPPSPSKHTHTTWRRAPSEGGAHTVDHARRRTWWVYYAEIGLSSHGQGGAERGCDIGWYQGNSVGAVACVCGGGGSGFGVVGLVQVPGQLRWRCGVGTHLGMSANMHPSMHANLYRNMHALMDVHLWMQTHAHRYQHNSW